VAAPEAPVLAIAAPVRAADDAGPASPSGLSSVRVGIDKIDLLMNMVGELVITQSMLGELDGEGPVNSERAAQIREGLLLLARNTRALQESVVRLRSMPVGVVFARLPRLVHDISHKLGKQIKLETSGQGTELDKTVLEKLGDPLTHIVRNSIDHGIEPPAERLAAGKPAHGTIRLHAEHRGSAIVIEISDDGRGLDHARILAIGKQRGLVAPDAQLHDDEIAKLVFAPGFSTASAVSDISGRGVGMDVVWRHLKEVGGDVHLESTRGLGTRTTLRVPLTLAIIDGQLIRVAEQCYVMPLLSIVETVELDPTRLKRLGAQEVYRVRDQVVPVVDLGVAFGLRARGEATSVLMMIVEADGFQLGLIVDELLAQQQIVVKSLETNFGRVDGLAGATILGDGRVAFIVDIVALTRGVRRQGRQLAA
jgi:two-component system chemotaxis sensor kinase CheA